jgi:hypothetical protein
MMMADIAIVMMGIMTVIGVVKFQNNVREQHVLMMVVAAYATGHMLHAGYGAGHGSLHENQHQRDAQQRARSFCRQVLAHLHADKLSPEEEAGNLPNPYPIRVRILLVKLPIVKICARVSGTLFIAQLPRS